MNQRGALGRFGEDVAVRRLRDEGLTVLERNWRCRAGEIDIVAHERAAAGRTLVVCEVKTRRAGRFQHPMAAVTPRKAERLRRLAQWWLSERWLTVYAAPPPGGVRIDLVGVLLPERGAPLVEHARGVA
ncbi:YraN family protein [Streptomyces sp. URMC 129]|uniref:YraN family protein n=1 Tax=Streptomyces sp. URMC 129 TaxID=3423407 RepID=UPI003F1DF8F0